MRPGCGEWRRLARFWPFPVALLAGLFVVGCGSESRVPVRLSAPTLTPQGIAYDPGMIQIHELTINEVDGKLYIATQTGLYRLSNDGHPERIAGIVDLKGFTIIEPGVFLASGHPSPAMISEQNAPPHLGLIRSTDGGLTWETVALLGEADFHVLRPVSEGLYGYSASQRQLMFSKDLVTWETRGSLDIYALVADPEDDNYLIAATPQGIAISEDGGRRWRMQAGAPPITVLAWGGLRKPVGITRFGQVVVLNEESVWETVFSFPAAPEALGLHEKTLLAGIHGQGIWQSDDGGETWEQIMPPQPPSYPR